MRIALDAFGGDFAPEINIDGAISAIKGKNFHISLVGNETILKPLVDHRIKSKIDLNKIEIIHAPEIVEMGEDPLKSFKRKKESSMKIALELVKDKYADAAISAGNSGAFMATALITLKKLPHIDRPALASIIPTKKSNCIMLDLGANVDCRVEHLIQFALMGSLYSEIIENKTNPRVGILSNGEEESKGNELTRSANHALKSGILNYVGYVEGRDIFSGNVDVVVCDGFIGNIALKTGEGLISAIVEMLKQEYKKNWLTKVGFILARRSLKKLMAKLDYKEYGGAPLLGVNGVTMICHGASDAFAIKNALLQCVSAVEQGYLNRLSEKLLKVAQVSNG